MIVVGFARNREPKPPLPRAGQRFPYPQRLRKCLTACRHRRIVAISGATIGVMFDNSMEAIVLRAYFATVARGYKFNYVEIPEDIDIGHNMLAFDPKQMRTGFRRWARNGEAAQSLVKRATDTRRFPPWALEAIRNPNAGAN